MRLGGWVRAMQAAGLQATLDDLRDIAWLAQQLGGADATPLPGGATGAVAAGPTPPPVPPPPPAGGPTPPPGGDSRSLPAGIQADASPPALYAAAGSGPLRARRVQLRGAPALPQALAIARALRPLSRRRPGHQQVLDERATAEFIADTGVRAPGWRPARERWFDVVLAVEDAPALAAWQPVLATFEKLLQRQGGFRSVTRWQLRAQGARLQAHGPGGRPCSPRALHDRDGRRLLLVLSDCTSAPWHRGTMGAWLERAAAEVPMALVQLLPPVLWPNTAVGFAELRMRAPRVAAPAARLEVRRPGWAVGEPGLALPVLALEPHAVAAWARMVAAGGDAWAQAALLPLAEGDGDAPSPTAPEPDAAARVAAFRASATLDAQRLAGYFSVVQPLTAPVMRVIQQAMAPESGAAALAQVFLAGVLQPVQAGSGADDTLYDFHPGVRERLEGGLTKAEFLRVNLALHELLQEQSGTAFDFFALLEDRQGGEHLPAQAQPFVQMARSAARRFAAGTASPSAAMPAVAPRAGALAEIRITVVGDRLHFQHHSARGDSNVYQPLPEGVHELLRRVIRETGESLNELRRAVMPLGLQDGIAYTEGPPWAELVLDREVVAYPWELLFRSMHDDRLPLALQRGLTRRPRQVPTPRGRRATQALVAGATQATHASGAIRALEAGRVEATLARCLPGDVRALPQADPRLLLAALADPTALRVLHVAVPGEWRREHDAEDGPRARALFAEGQTLGLDDLALRLGVPELVFLSVDHGAAVAPRLLESGAAVVVAPTGPVHPEAAAVFADTFYTVLANGQTLLEATHQARAACHQRLPDSDAWGRYQVWGDPAWRLLDGADPPRVEPTAAPTAAPTTAPTPAPAPFLPPRHLPRLAECSYTAYVCYAQADDSAWFNWVTQFGEELQRNLAAMMRGVRLPPLHMAGRNGPVQGLLTDELRRAIGASFSLILVVHDHLVQSTWAQHEVAVFRELFGDAGLRERLYIVAMSEAAVTRLSTDAAWQRVLPVGELVWMPFFEPQDSSRPLDIYLGPGLVAPAFRGRFERLRGDLVGRLRQDLAGAGPTGPQPEPDPDPEPEPEPRAPTSARIYVESNRHERTLWEPIGQLLQSRWDLLLRSRASNVTGPAPRLRIRGLPVDQLDAHPPLDDADGVMLLWGRKTAEALVAHVNKVEDKLAQGTPGIVAYLIPPNHAEEPVPAWGWRVARLDVRDEGNVQALPGDEAALDTFLSRILERVVARDLGNA